MAVYPLGGESKYGIIVYLKRCITYNYGSHGIDTLFSACNYF